LASKLSSDVSEKGIAPRAPASSHSTRRRQLPPSPSRFQKTRIRTPEAKQRVLCPIEREVVRVHLERDDCDVDVHEEVELDPRHVEVDGRPVGERAAYACDVAAAIDPDARLPLLVPVAADARAGR
jgi:hypothetical protein